jgi:hypothetical protein
VVSVTMRTVRAVSYLKVQNATSVLLAISCLKKDSVLSVSPRMIPVLNAKIIGSVRSAGMVML